MSVAGPGRWSDLRVRMISAAMMASVGALEIWLGGPTFLVLVLLATGAMIWELARLTAPDAPTMASVSPSLTEKLTPSTARFTPSGVRKWVCKFSTSSKAKRVLRLS